VTREEQFITRARELAERIAYLSGRTDMYWPGSEGYRRINKKLQEAAVTLAVFLGSKITWNK
jgi:hypothetical protein